MAVGRRFFFYSLVGMTALSLSVAFIQIPIHLEDKVLNALWAGLISGAGVGISLRSSGSQGGIDILSVMLLKRFSIGIGNTILAVNIIVLLLVALATTVHSVALLMAPLVVWGAMLPFIAISARRALMSAVPKDQQGEASGVNLTVQMLGGAVGMALCGALLVATGSYWSLFLMTGVLVFALLVVAWFTVERPAVSGS